MKEKLPQVLLKAVGVLNVAMALAGAALVAFDLTTHSSLWQKHPIAFPGMLLSSSALLCALIVSGILLIRGSDKAPHFGMSLYAAEMVYFILAALFPATGGAFAVANVGLFPQLVTAFPIWALMMVWWFSRKPLHQEEAQNAHN